MLIVFTPSTCACDCALTLTARAADDVPDRHSRPRDRAARVRDLGLALVSVEPEPAADPPADHTETTR